ncbi:MAG: RHS repeat-associated core domain-containing protein, partial [Bacteroidales bacterium]
YNLTMGYAANGNILTKSDVGTNTFEYTHPTKPYALTDLETASGLVPEELQVATYTSFEQVSTIEEGDYYATFTYNSDGQRAKMLVTDLGSTILTRWYVGSRYVKEVKGSLRQYTWIGGDAYTAPVLVYQYGTTTNWYYVLRDYLGNITHLVWTSNNVAAEYSFDAWGRRRDRDDWSYTLAGDAELIGDRGFTGHEWLPWFNLYNMNGRLYDPVVGRFLSADNYVQMPGFSQSFNRYSYALNNPLIYIDPTGEKWKWPKFTWFHAIPIIGQLDYFMQMINDNTVGLRQKMVDANIPAFGGGYNTSNGSFHYVGNSGNIYHRLPRQMAKADQKVYKKLNEVRQSHSSAWYAANGVGIMGEFVGTTGFGLSFEIAFPKFVTTNLFSYTGAGIDVGILRDRNGLGFYATTKTTKESGVAFSAQVEFLNAYNRPSSAPNVNIDRTYLVGPGYETGLGIGPIGGSYGVSNAADYGRISTYQMISISLGLGLDAGFVNWNTNTYVTGGY